jgi:hypothetical protein
MSSYSSPAALGSAQGTGAYSVGIAEQAGTTNNDGHAVDSAGNIVVDYVWGTQLPIQPNDQRTETAAVNIGGSTGSNALGYKTAVVTAATSSGSGATAIITYTSANTFNVGQNVTITGLTTTAANLSDVKVNTLVGSAGAYTGFTVLSTVSVSDTAQTAVAKAVESALPGVGADYGWSATTAVTGARLDFAGTSAYSGSNVIPNKTVYSSRHEIVETGWASYPSFTPATGKFTITQATGDGTTIRYESLNFLSAGDSVNITGVGALNLSAATVATATRDYFTVTNGTTGSVININNGIVERTDALTAADGSQISGVDYIKVPSILGLTTALGLDALKDAGYATANITNTIGATNTATQPTRINVTTTTAATVTVAGGTSTWAVGTKVTISAGTGIPTALVGSWTVTGGSGSTLIIAGTGWTVADTGAITPGTQLKGTPLTVKSQSTAANAASVALSATITMTSWA